MNLLKMAEYYRTNKLSTFTPSPALVDFMDDENPRIFVRAANRVGKTVHAAAKFIKRMLDKPGRYRAIGVTHKQTIDVISKLLYEFIPPNQMSPDCKYTLTNGFSNRLIILKNGSLCEIKSCDQDPVAHAGSDLDGVWCDEPPPRAIFSENLGRVFSRSGFFWVTATPIGRPLEWFKEIIEADDTEWKEYVVALTKDNCPWYAQAQIDKFYKEMLSQPWDYRQRIFGDWEGITTGRIFSGFDPDCLFTVLPKGNYYRGIGLDHGESAGKQAAIYVLWDQDGIWVTDERINTKATSPIEDGLAIRQMLSKNKCPVEKVNFWKGDSNSAGKLGSGRKINAILAEEISKQEGWRKVGIEIETPYKNGGSIDLGYKLINGAFLEGKLHIHENCVTLIKSLKHFTGKEEDLKHVLDALRYILHDTLEERSITKSSVTRYNI